MAWAGSKWTWTEADVAVLTTMWQAGAVDTAIAAVLGLPGRNYVVGKLTRMKLTRCPGAKQRMAAECLERAMQPKARAPIREPVAPIAEPVVVAAPVAPPSPTPRPTKPAPILVKPARKRPAPIAEPVVIAALVDPFAMFTDGGLTIVDLNAQSCRFPSGDPKLDLRYCGAVAHGIGPYCLFHHKVAFSGFTKVSAAPNQLRIGR